MTSLKYKKDKFIYVVDDSKAYRCILENILKMSGYRVASFGEPREALNRIEEDRPHLVLSDIEMPLMDGFKFFLEVKMNPEVSHIPFLFISSTDCEHMKKTAVALSNKNLLRKPASYMAILESIEGFFIGFNKKPTHTIHFA